MPLWLHRHRHPLQKYPMSPQRLTPPSLHKPRLTMFLKISQRESAQKHIHSHPLIPQIPLIRRFIMNLPDQELASKERLCFQVEQAYVQVSVLDSSSVLICSENPQALVL